MRAIDKCVAGEKRALQQVQRGTDTRIPVAFVKQPTGEPLDPATLEGLAVKVENEGGALSSEPPYTIEGGQLIVEVTKEISESLGVGVYTLKATGRLADPSYEDGYHDYTITTELCRVVRDAVLYTPTTVTANVLAGLKGKSAYEIAVKHGYQGTEEEWIKSLTPKGGAGGGGNGKSAYELAVQEGYQGTLQEWLKSLVGKDGADAYEVAKKAGYAGSREEWLKTLIGATGLSAYQLAKSEGYEGSLTEWIASLKGADGESAYKVAVRNGYVGDERAWLASLKGADGKDAYEVAKAGGYGGSREAWLESLKGEAGKSAYELAKEAQSFTGTLTEYLASLKGAKGKDAYDDYLETTTDNPKLTREEWSRPRSNNGNAEEGMNKTEIELLYKLNNGTGESAAETTTAGALLLDADGHRRDIISAMRAKGVSVADTDGLTDLAVKIQEIKVYVFPVYSARQFGQFKGANLPTLEVYNEFNPADFGNMFASSASLKALPEIRNAGQISSISQMCTGCASMTTAILPDLPAVALASGAFYGCAALETLTIGAMPRCTTLASLATICASLKTLNIGECPNVAEIAQIAYGCSSLTEVTIGTGDALTKVDNAFNGCSRLRRINGTLDFTKLASTANIFFGCEALEEVRIKGLKVDLSLQQSANLSTESVKYLVDNLQQATGKSITLPRAWQTAHTAEAREYSQKASAKGFTLNFR
nr:MAG TPA: tail sheath protein [Caudoviricetes sp.]